MTTKLSTQFTFTMRSFFTPACAIAALTLSAVSSALAASCTFTNYNSFNAGKKACQNIVVKDMAVPAGQTLDFDTGKDNLNIKIQGKITFGYKEWEGPLVNFGGSGLTVTSDGILDGDGKRWWDGKGGNGGKTKPKFVYIHKVTDSTFTGLHILNGPVHVFSINGAKTVHLDSITIENPNGEALGAHNTDGFDIGSSDHVTISNSNVYNQDDCIAVNSGTNLLFSKMTCQGGHGGSIGSIGNRNDNVVRGVIFEHIKFIDSENGCRIKTISGAPSGTVDNITYRDITLQNIKKYGIDVQQDYLNGGPNGKPTGGISITGLHFEGIHGSVASSATPVYVLCANCRDWTVSDVKITGGKASSCKGAPTKGCL